MKSQDLEKTACSPCPIYVEGFNPEAKLPFGLTIDHLSGAMNDFIDFLGFINSQLNTKELPRLESFLMPANFSSIVGEFMVSSIPKFCKGLVKNQYHNGHPDLIPVDLFPSNAVQHADTGIEVKGSRHKSGWQGHNPENIWLMVFVFDSNTSRDDSQGIAPRPFRFEKVVGAELREEDWAFSGRSETSRRTITASVTRTGYNKMEKNWIYRAPS